MIQLVSKELFLVWRITPSPCQWPKLVSKALKAFCGPRSPPRSHSVVFWHAGSPLRSRSPDFGPVLFVGVCRTKHLSEYLEVDCCTRVSDIASEQLSSAFDCSYTTPTFDVPSVNLCYHTLDCLSLSSRALLLFHWIFMLNAYRVNVFIIFQFWCHATDKAILIY